MGTKRGRFLMRQSRVKRGDTDVAGTSQHQSSSDYHHLTVPHRMVERQVSDPLPAGQTVTISPPPTTQLLSVPGGGGGGGTAILVKQHSHPLLPSQQSQYQLGSPPITTSSHGSLQHSTSVDVDLTGPVIYIDALTTSSAHDTTSLGIASATTISSSGTSTSGPTTATLRVRTDELKRSASSPSQSSGRSSHCPVVRSGPALGCNYCWNTVDTHGRILRRKTKYHCPECQTNLCIVPCFQEYHERQNATGGGNQTDPIALTTSVMRAFPKTSSM